MTAEPTSLEPQNEQLFQQILAYDWSSDADFQRGLQSILPSSDTIATSDQSQSQPQEPSQEQDQLLLRAKCFYFAKKHGVVVDWSKFIQWNSLLHPPTTTCSQATQKVTENGNGQQASSGPDAAPYPTSFSEIVELIQTGKAIPGIKDVPDTVLEGQASAASAVKRKKPWEKAATAVES